MAESMCGPSNALQNFQKHSTVDRTLQQDRLISRNSPAQGFRSSPGPNAGLLDPEFVAFQEGQLPLDHGFQPQGFSNNPQNFQQSGPSDWASAFQQLHISSPAPQLQQQPFNPQVQQRQYDAGWHEEFARQQGQMSNMGQMPSQMNTQFRNMGGMMPQFMGGHVQPQANMSMAQQTQQPAEASDEAFARAFEEAERVAFEEAERSALETQQETNQGQSVELGQDILINESAERLMGDSPADLLDQQRIGADTIHDPLDQSPEAREQQDDPNALSKTAGELLHSVQKDQSSKFQNSQFLQLMRLFRDKEATVKGDQVVGIDMGMGQEALKERMISMSKFVLGLIFEQNSPNHEKLRIARSVFSNLFEMSCIGALIDPEGLEQLPLPLPELLAMVDRLVDRDFLSLEFLRPLAMNLNRSDLYRNPSRVLGDSIAAANSEIDLSSFSQFLGIEPHEKAHEYVTSLLSNNPPSETTRLLKVLPYALKSQPTDATLPIHLERARDFLGRDIEYVRRTCEARGMLKDTLTVEHFFMIVNTAQRWGVDSDDFTRALSTVMFAQSLSDAPKWVAGQD